MQKNFINFLIYCRKSCAWKEIRNIVIFTATCIMIHQWEWNQLLQNYLVIYNQGGSTRQANSNKNVMFHFLCFMYFVISSVKLQLPWMIQAFHTRNQNPQNQILHHTGKWTSRKHNLQRYQTVLFIILHMHSMNVGISGGNHWKKGNKYYVITTCVTNAVSQRHMCIKLVMLIWIVQNVVVKDTA